MNKYLNPKSYMKFFINKLFVILSPVIKFWEKRYFGKYGNQPLKHQPVFIIGAPRTGSTILYQTITNQLDVLYIDNLACKFFRNLFFGFWLSNKIFKQKAHNCFKSNHGDTNECGLHAPSECGAFWYRWLPKDRHFIDYDDINEKMIKEIREEITTIINYFDKPLIINNNNIALRIRLIKEAFPDAYFIVADREPFFVAQSLLLARKKFFKDIKMWWSILPKEIEIIKKEEPCIQVVMQHYYINKQMYNDLNNLISSNKWVKVLYKDFCVDHHKIVDKIKILLNYNIERYDFYLPNVTCSKQIKLENEKLKKINNYIKRFNWNDY